MKKHISTIFLVLVFIAGLSVFLYPTVSDFINRHQQKQVVNEYQKAVEQLDEVDKEAMIEQAVEYNKQLAGYGQPNFKKPYNHENYDRLLSINGGEVMGVITIPKIDVELPIYHGTRESVLQIAVGHLEGSSLPVGGESTHAILSGHRGLPSANLFTDLDRMEIHDVFTITVLGQELIYEVDQIKIVEPGNTDYLQIEEGQDYVTLLTCTPYGINTHRLLVRGKRVQKTETERTVYIYADAYEMDKKTVAVVMAVPLTIVILIGIFVHTGRKRRRMSDIRQILTKYDIDIQNEEETNN